MIRIVIENKDLILNQDTVIKLSLVFPAPELDKMPSSVVQWFNIPAIEHNDTILNYARFIETAEKVKVYDNVIMYFGIRSKKGKLIVKTTSNNYYKVSFTFNKLPHDFKDKMINTLSYANYNIGADGDTQTIIDNAKARSMMSYPATDFVFPQIYNPEFYDTEINASFDEYANKYRANDNFYTNFSSGRYIFNKNTLIPHFFLLSILDAVMQNANLHTEGSFFDDVKIHKLLLFNNFAIDYIRKDEYFVKAITTPNVVKSKTFGDQGESYFDFDNEVDDDNVFSFNPNIYTLPVQGVYLFTVNFWARYDDALSGDYDGISIEIQKDGAIGGWGTVAMDTFEIVDNEWHEYLSEFYIEFDAADVGHEYSFRIWLNNPDHATDEHLSYKDVVYTINPTTYNNVNLFSGNIITANHIPAVSVSDFVNNISKLFSLAVFFDHDNGRVIFEKIKDILKSPKIIDLTEFYILDSEEIDLANSIYTHTMEMASNTNSQSVSQYPLLASIYSSEKPTPKKSNELYYIIDTNKYILSFLDENSLTLFFKTYRDEFSGINEIVSDSKKNDIKISTLPNRITKDSLGRMYSLYPMPHSDCKITSLALGTGINEFKFQIINYHGFVENGGLLKPSASNTHFNSNGDDLGGLSLKLNGEDGIFANYSKEYYKYIEDREVVKFKLSIEENQLYDIMQLFEADSDIRKIRIKNRNYLPVKIEVEIGMNGIVNTLATLR